MGPYTYNDSIERFVPGAYDTRQIIADNGEQVMYQSYALVRYADGLVTSHSNGGHAMMCYSDPVVVYNADGSINGKESYLTIIDQHSRWVRRIGEQGDAYYCKNYIDRRFNFEDLLKEYYLPFTFAEFLGTDPVEKSETTFSHKGESIAVYQLRVASVTSNYGISDIYAVLLDEAGNEVLCEVKRADRASVKELDFAGVVHRPTWKSYADGKHRVEIRCQLGTGERLTIYCGALVE